MLASCSRSLYAIRVLCNDGLLATSLTDVFRANIIAKLKYCSLVWSGLTSAHDRVRIDAFLRCSKRYGYCADGVPVISDIFTEADQSLFRRILNYESHPVLPEETNCTYNLHLWQHDRQLTRKSAHIIDFLFFIRKLYKDSYWWFMICIFFYFTLLFCCVVSTPFIRIYRYGYSVDVEFPAQQ